MKAIHPPLLATQACANVQSIAASGAHVHNTTSRMQHWVRSPSSLDLSVPIFGGTIMTIQKTANAPGATWRAILSRESLEAFASAFVKAPVLVASVANSAVHGAEAIRTFFQASAAIYETIAFTSEASLGHRTFLEWKGSALGGKAIEGITILAHDASALIERIELYHRPLAIVLAFAGELEQRLGETLGAKLFARAR
jgi:hypothetical protein